jgi:hypothetical protein
MVNRKEAGAKSASVSKIVQANVHTEAILWRLFYGAKLCQAESVEVDAVK